MKPFVFIADATVKKVRVFFAPQHILLLVGTEGAYQGTSESIRPF
jgi:hypothetical protein